MAYNFSNTKVLLVNDVSSTRKIMATALQINQVNAVHEAMDGSQAFRSFQEHSPDVVITELNMSPMDGRWLAKKIRSESSGSPKRDVPIILITNDSSALSIPDIRDTGFDELLMVPFTVDSIADRIAYVLNNPREFVESEDYAGPDRRRAETIGYEGPFRREIDPADKREPGAVELDVEQADAHEDIGAEWPPKDESKEMLDTLFDHYIKHHEIVLTKLKLAQQATGQSEQADVDADEMWKEVIGLFAKSGISEDEISKIEGMMNVLPKDIEAHFKDLSARDENLQKMEKELDETGYQRAHSKAKTLQDKPNPLSGMSGQDYHEEEQEPEKRRTAKVQVFKVSHSVGKFKR